MGHQLGSWVNIGRFARSSKCILGMYLSLMATAAVGQVATAANAEYSTPAQRERAASQMDPWIRGSLQRSGPLVESLSLRPGDTVADIGTGVGHLLPYIASQIGASGTIFAVDVYPEFLNKARERIAAEGWKNVHAVLGTEHDPKLPVNRLNGAILLDTYHHLNYPEETMRAVHRALKPGGRLFIIDYYRSRENPAANLEVVRRHIRLDQDDVVKEVQAQGFHLAKQFDHMPFLYVLVFEKR